MSTAVDAITITLIQAVGGLTAEINGLPVQIGPDYVRQHRNYELAAEALRAKYPQFVIRGSWVQGETSYVFLVERL